ncbi:MAG: PHP domain-containing protein [Clostridia bacterium]|nr:PHP domain-containing protein [Clostridia bacterium]
MITKIYDLHTHTTFSDGKTSPEYMIEKAKKNGYHTGVSDHLFCSGNETIEKIEKYLDHVETLGIPVGGETNIGELLPLTDKQAARFDYLIASVHAVFPDDLPFEKRVMPQLISPSPEIPYPAYAPVVLGRYFGMRGKFRDNWEGYDESCSEYYLNQAYKQMVHYFSNFRGEIIGHCCVNPFYDALPYDSKTIIDWENAVIALCKKYNVAMEISSLWLAPQDRRLIAAKNAGLKCTFGCDCHSVEAVGELGFCLETAERIGLTDDDLYIPSTH